MYFMEKKVFFLGYILERMLMCFFVFNFTLVVE